MRSGNKLSSDSNYFNKEVALNELLGAFISDDADVTSVGDSASSVTLLASNSARKGFKIFNDSTAILYVKYGATASTSSFTVRLTPYGIHEGVGYTGRIDGIWASDAGGNARITELT
jgi:hypothetical protein